MNEQLKEALMIQRPEEEAVCRAVLAAPFIVNVISTINKEHTT